MWVESSDCGDSPYEPLAGSSQRNLRKKTPNGRCVSSMQIYVAKQRGVTIQYPYTVAEGRKARSFNI